MIKFLKNYLGYLIKELPSTIFYVALFAAFAGIIAGTVALLINLYCETNYLFKDSFVFVSKWFFMIIFFGAYIIDIITIPLKKKYADSLAIKLDVPIDDIYEALFKYKFKAKDFNVKSHDFLIKLKARQITSKLFK